SRPRVDERRRGTGKAAGTLVRRAGAGRGIWGMRRSLRRAWLPVACGLLLGCEHGRTSHYPPDPLLVSKKPVESRPEPGAGPVLAQHEPPSPESLFTSVAAREAAHRPALPTSLPREQDEE